MVADDPCTRLDDGDAGEEDDNRGLGTGKRVREVGVEAIQYPDAEGGVGAPEIEMEEATKARERRQESATGMEMEGEGNV